MYPDVESALRCAYRTESTAVVPTCRALRDLRGGTVRLSSPMTATDRIVQSAYTMMLAEDVLGAEGMVVVRAHHTIPATAGLRARKQADLWALLGRMLEEWEHFRRLDRWYLLDVLREWAGLSRDHDERWWAQHLQSAPSTLCQWRLGQKGSRMVGFEMALRLLLGGAHDSLREPFSEAGIVD